MIRRVTVELEIEVEDPDDGVGRWQIIGSRLISVAGSPREDEEADSFSVKA